MEQVTADAVTLLKQLIQVASFSTAEGKTADTIAAFLEDRGIETNRLLNNVWVRNKYFDDTKPTILLNSHHDTVPPNAQYTRNPFEPKVEDGKLYGLGSNDAGGALVSLIACFLHFYNDSDLRFNLIYAATAEEEISGPNGVEILLPHLGSIDCGIVGEPTKMNIAIAEKGLLVIDCVVHGKSGHAAREEGENSIYKALKDIEWFRTYQFPEVSDTLGPVKMAVTMIQAGVQHNVVPDSCTFTVDIRTTDKYSTQETLDVIQQNISAVIQPRSARLNPSCIDPSHPMVQAGLQLNRATYGSPTTSDQALMSFATVKMGPGDSARSHTADEFIYLKEIEEGVQLYIQLIDNFNRL